MTNKEKPIKEEKIYFDVETNVLVPAVIVVRVLAKDEQEAVRLAETMAPTSISYKLNMKKKIKLVVRLAGQTIIKYFKNF